MLLNEKYFRDLARHHENPCISLYSPTHQKGMETLEGEDRTRWKNLLKTAAEALSSRSSGSSGRREDQDVLRRGWELYEDDDFWRHQGAGLAALLSPGRENVFRLPYGVPERCRVEDRFHLAPLVPSLCDARHVYILTLSENQVRLLELYGDRIVEIVLEDDVPTEMVEALRIHEKRGELQHHGAHEGASTATLYHGHGEGHDDESALRRQFFARIDRALGGFLDGGIPILPAGVDENVAAFREVASLLLTEEALPGNHDKTKPHELAGMARQRLPAPGRDARAEQAERFAEWRDSAEVLTDPQEIVRMAVRGRVDTLFFDTGSCLPGIWEEAEDRATLLGEDANKAGKGTCLIDLAVCRTMLYGGTTYRRMPGEPWPEGLEEVGMAAMYHS